MSQHRVSASSDGATALEMAKDVVNNASNRTDADAGT